MTTLRDYCLRRDVENHRAETKADRGEVVTRVQLTTDEIHLLARLAEEEGDRATFGRDEIVGVELQKLASRLLRAERAGLAEVDPMAVTAGWPR